VIQLHWPLLVSVVGAFLLQVNDLIIIGLRSRAGSAAQWLRQSAGCVCERWAQDSSPAGLREAGAPSGWMERAQPHGVPGKKSFSWGLRDQQLRVCGLYVLDHRRLPKQASCWLPWADGAPCSRFLKNSERFFFFSSCFLCPSTEWKLAEVSEKGSENEKQFPTHF